MNEATMDDQTGLAALPKGSRLSERRLDNGVRTLAIEVPTARKVRLVCAIGVGYLDEPEELPGLAHLLEHALFLGSPRHPEPGDFATWVGEQGGCYNAHTDEYTTDVHLTLPPEAVQAGLEGLLDIVLHPFLNKTLIAQEVDIIEAEFQARLADPELHRQRAMSRLFQAAHPAFYCHHGDRHSLGANLPALQTALARFHARHYRAERLSLVMLGPQSLASQLALLAETAAKTSGGAGPLPVRTWRWAKPARVQWSPPEGQPPADPTLELLWPLPDPLTPTQRQVAEHLTHILCDGELATTLQQHDAICDLELHLAAENDGPFLSLRLTLSESGRQHSESLIATCKAWIECLLAHRLTTDGLVTAQTSTMPDLDVWPKTLARRLAVDASALSADSSATLDIQQAIETLAPMLKAGRCRVLEAIPTLDQCETIAETGTHFRYRSSAPLSATWPARSPPALSRRYLLTDDTAPMPGLIADSERVSVWWGDGPNLPGAFWCLARPAPTADSATRRRHWQQRTLALRQTALVQGVALRLGGDRHGDWLMATGDATRLESCLTQALRLWPSQVSTTLSNSTEGLLAQRLLNLLNTLPTAQQKSDSRILVWAGGTLSAAETRAGCQRLMTSCLDSCISSCAPPSSSTAVAPSPASAGAASTTRANGMDWPIGWLPPQGEDAAVMLQFDAPDASPTSQTLFQLLAQCHDAAFHRELRQEKKLGYAVAVRYREADDGWPRLGYVVQSPHASIAILREAVGDFLKTQGIALARLNTATFTRRCTAMMAKWGPPETPHEALIRAWQALRLRRGALTETLTPWKAQQAALRELNPEMLAAQASALVEGRLSGQWWVHPSLGNDPYRL